MSEEKTEKTRESKGDKPDERPEKPDKGAAAGRSQASKPRETELPVSVLFEREGVSPILKNALMAAYGWRPDTLLAASEFRRKVETWLKQPANGR